MKSHGNRNKTRSDTQNEERMKRTKLTGTDNRRPMDLSVVTGMNTLVTIDTTRMAGLCSPEVGLRPGRGCESVHIHRSTRRSLESDRVLT